MAGERSALSPRVFLVQLIIWTEALCSVGELREESRTDVHSAGDTVKIVLLLPMNNSYPFSMQKVKLAFNYTLSGDTVRTILPFTRFEIIPLDSKCSPVTAPINAVNARLQQVFHAFFGPVCDYSLAPVARYSPYWNIPVISVGGMAHDLGTNKTQPDAECPLMTRVGVTFPLMVKGIIAVMHHHKWKRLIILYNQNDGVTPRFCFLAISAVLAQIKHTNIHSEFSTFDQDRPDYGMTLRTKVNNKFAS